MKTNTTNNSPTSSAAVVSGFTLGLDLGNRQHHVCVLDAAGNIVREASLPNTRPALAQLLMDYRRIAALLCRESWTVGKRQIQRLRRDRTTRFAKRATCSCWMSPPDLAIT